MTWTCSEKKEREERRSESQCHVKEAKHGLEEKTEPTLKTT